MKLFFLDKQHRVWPLVPEALDHHIAVIIVCVLIRRKCEPTNSTNEPMFVLLKKYIFRAYGPRDVNGYGLEQKLDFKKVRGILLLDHPLLERYTVYVSSRRNSLRSGPHSGESRGKKIGERSEPNAAWEAIDETAFSTPLYSKISKVSYLHNVHFV